MNKNYKKPPKLKGLHFSKKEILKCVKNNALLRISIAPSKLCNLKCPFCYASAFTKKRINNLKGELSFEEIKSIILQAKNLGAKTITLGGGEPLIYPKIKELISFINSKKLIPLIFTNGLAISKELSKFLFSKNSSIIMKLNSLKEPAIHDEMVGNIKGVHAKIRKRLDILIETGFNKTKPTRLAIESVISRRNLAEIPNIFRYARRNNIHPYLELVTPSGRGKNYNKVLSKKEAKRIFYDLLKIDESEFGLTWIPHPPQIANSCQFFLTAIYIGANGRVQPCPTVDIELGNLRSEKLSEIIKKPLTAKFKNIKNNIKGKCRDCIKCDNLCYGCRGAAFGVSGDAFGQDPVCWRN
jgi:radical SAM protein with 4Fe4S-binding SPASM domain